MQSIFGTDGIRGRFNEEITIRESIDNLAKEEKLNEKIINNEFSSIKGNKKNEVMPRSHG